MRRARARVAPLVLPGAALQVGWLLLWPIGYALSRARPFTDLLLAEVPGVRAVLGGATALLAGLAPGLDTSGPSPAILAALGLTLSLLVLAYAAGVAAVARVGARGLPLVVGFGLLFQATVALMPGVLTTDPFSYLTYGYLAGVRGLNPYVDPPSAVADFPLMPLIHPLWQNTPSVYGPLWERLIAGLGALLAGAGVGPVGQVLALKGLANGVHLLNLGLLWQLLGRLGAERQARVVSLALVAWNPLLLLETAAGAHNEAFALTLLLLACVMLPARPARRPPLPLGEGGGEGVLGCPQAARSPGKHVTARPVLPAQPPGLAAPSPPARTRWLGGLLLAGLAALVKYSAGLVGLWLAVAWARRLPGWPARAAWLGGAGLLLASAALLLALPWLRLPEMLVPLLAAGERSSNALPDAVAALVADRLPDPPAAYPGIRDTVRGLARAVFGVYLVWEARRVWLAAAAGDAVVTRALLAGAARSLLALNLLALTWVQAWYFTWPLALAAPLGWRSHVARLAVGYSAVAFVVFNLRDHWYVATGEEMPGALLGVYALAPLLALGAGWLAARMGQRAASEPPAGAEAAVADRAAPTTAAQRA